MSPMSFTGSVWSVKLVSALQSSQFPGHITPCRRTVLIPEITITIPSDPGICCEEECKAHGTELIAINGVAAFVLCVDHADLWRQIEAERDKNAMQEP